MNRIGGTRKGLPFCPGVSTAWVGAAATKVRSNPALSAGDPDERTPARLCPGGTRVGPTSSHAMLLLERQVRGSAR